MITVKKEDYTLKCSNRTWTDLIAFDEDNNEIARISYVEGEVIYNQDPKESMKETLNQRMPNHLIYWKC